MTRPPSSDEPSRLIFHHMHRPRWRRVEGLYVTSDGLHTQADYTRGQLTLGQPYIAEREASKDLWRIDQRGPMLTRDLVGSGNYTGSPDTESIFAYKWHDGVGWGTKYAEPSPMPFTFIYSCMFSATGLEVFTSAGISGPGVYAWPWTIGVGFGVVYADPAGAQVPYSVGLDVLNVGGETVELIISGQEPVGQTAVAAYPWTVGVGYGTRYADPATPLDNSNSRTISDTVDFADDGASVIASGGVTPNAYAWTPGGGFGSKWSSPTLAAGFFAGGGSSATRFTHASDAVGAGSFGMTGSEHPAHFWPWSSASGYGVKFADAVGYDAFQTIWIEFTDADDAVFISSGGHVNAFAFSSATGVGVKYTDLSPMPAVHKVTVLNDDTLFIAGNSADVGAYHWSTVSGFGTKYADPATPPAVSETSRWHYNPVTYLE